MINFHLGFVRQAIICWDGLLWTNLRMARLCELVLKLKIESCRISRFIAACVLIPRCKYYVFFRRSNLVHAISSVQLYHLLELDDCCSTNSTVIGLLKQKRPWSFDEVLALRTLNFKIFSERICLEIEFGLILRLQYLNSIKFEISEVTVEVVWFIAVLKNSLFPKNLELCL